MSYLFLEIRLLLIAAGFIISLHSFLAINIETFDVRRLTNKRNIYSFATSKIYSPVNGLSTKDTSNDRIFKLYNGLDLPVPLNATSQLALLKWVSMLTKLKETVKNSSIGEVSRKMGLSEDMLRTLIMMSFKVQSALIQTNMRLVYSIAYSYRGKGVELDDLIQEGVGGLKKAIEKFDISRNCSFSTYAYPWIKEYIRSALASAAPITIPNYVYRLLLKVYGAQERLYLTLGRMPQDGEIMDELGIDSNKYDIVRRAMALESRLTDADMNDDELEQTYSIYDLPEDSTTYVIRETVMQGIQSREPPPSEFTLAADNHAAVLKVLSTLPLEESIAIQDRLGIGKLMKSPQNSHNNIESGEESKMTSSVAKHLYNKGLRRLRRRLEKYPDKYPEMTTLESFIQDMSGSIDS